MCHVTAAADKKIPPVSSKGKPESKDKKNVKDAKGGKPGKEGKEVSFPLPLVSSNVPTYSGNLSIIYIQFTAFHFMSSTSCTVIVIILIIIRNNNNNVVLRHMLL